MHSRCSPADDLEAMKHPKPVEPVLCIEQPAAIPALEPERTGAIAVQRARDIIGEGALDIKRDGGEDLGRVLEAECG